MKSFKEYLLESKQNYEFKLKIVGEQPKDMADKIKTALQTYKVEHVSAAKTTPIQETQVDFPDQKNISVSVYDISTNYPVTCVQIATNISEALSTPLSNIRVRNKFETAEEELNTAHYDKKYNALLGTDYESECNQNLVGENHKMSFLSSLNSISRKLEQYSGINDELFPQTQHSEKSNMQCSKPTTSNSIIGSRTTKKPTAAKTGK
jgi:hypothetical protein